MTYPYAGYSQPFGNAGPPKSFDAPYKDRELNDKLESNGTFYSSRAYAGNRVYDQSTDSTKGAVYELNTDTPDPEKAVTREIKADLDRIYVHVDEETGAFYPASYVWTSEVVSEDNLHTRSCEYAMVQCDEYLFNSNGTTTSWYHPRVSISKAYMNGDSDHPLSNATGTISGTSADSPVFHCNYGAPWGSYISSLFHSDNRPSDIRDIELYANDGFTSDTVYVFYMGPGETEYTDITEHKSEYFDQISCNTGNQWTFRLSDDAPCGMYKIIPYFIYHMDLSYASDRTIRLYDSATYDLDRTKETEITTDAVNNRFRWIMPYDPFYINSVSNDKSYLLNFTTDNEGATLNIEENEYNTAASSVNRYAYFSSSAAEPGIRYVGYGNYETGSDRIDKFDIAAFVDKDCQESNVTLQTPYKARLEVWIGAGSPIHEDGTIETDGWVSAPYRPEEGEDTDHRTYRFHLVYNPDVS